MVAIMEKFAVIVGTVLLLGLGATIVVASPLDSIIQEVNQLKTDMDKTQGELANLDREVETTTKAIIRIYQQIEREEHALALQQQALDNRILDVYKNYDYLVLSVFLEARDLSDLWRRFTFLAKINQADNELLTANRFRTQRVRELENELADKKRIQVQLKRRKQVEYAATEREYRYKKAALETKLQEVRQWQASMARMKRQPLVMSD